MPAKANDFLGQTFGVWTVTAKLGRDRWGDMVWECHCPHGCRTKKTAVHLRKMWDCKKHPTRGAKLTASEVQTLRHVAGRKPHHELAAAFDVSRSAVSQILLGYTWRHV